MILLHYASNMCETKVLFLNTRKFGSVYISAVFKGNDFCSYDWTCAYQIIILKIL